MVATATVGIEEPLNPLQVPSGKAREREQKVGEVEGWWRPTTPSSRCQGWSFDTMASQGETEEKWRLSSPSLLMGSVANQAQLSLSLSNSNDDNDDKNNDNDQRPSQILQPSAELPRFEGKKKVDVLTFDHCMGRIALVAHEQGLWKPDCCQACQGSARVEAGEGRPKRPRGQQVQLRVKAVRQVTKGVLGMWPRGSHCNQLPKPVRQQVGQEPTFSLQV